MVPDLKVVNLILGQQAGNTGYPCFLCEWPSRARELHYKQFSWPSREDWTIGNKNIVANSLVPIEKIIPPPLHIKLGVFTQFVKALKKRESEAYRALGKIFPKVSEDKRAAGVYDGPQIRRLMQTQLFAECMDLPELRAWNQFKSVCDNFLGNYRSPDAEVLVKELISTFEAIGANMSLKLHLLASHYAEFGTGSLGAKGDEQGERHHQDIKSHQRRYKGKSLLHMVCDFNCIQSLRLSAVNRC